MRSAPPPATPPLARLRGGLAVLWRPDGSVQLGTSPRSSLLLRGLTPPQRACLATLAGAPGPGAPTPAAGQGTLPGPGSGASLLALLRESGALDSEGTAGAGHHPSPQRWVADGRAWAAAHPAGPRPAERLARRRAHRVTVLGGGRTGTGIATTLAAAGIGGVEVVDRTRAQALDVAPVAAAAPDLGGSRSLAAHRAVVRAAEGFAPPPTATHDRGQPDVVVLVQRGAADASAADGLVAEGIPHLSVVVRDSDVLVGPFVVPGTTPCLRCLDLHRTDLDPGWPHVVTQLPAAPPQRCPAEETATATAVAGLASLQVLAHVDGAPVSSQGATLELLVPETVVRRRPWSVHPQCGCTELPVPGT
ncbi:bacteriocin biosynthesis cyclodehydratase domain-containing protein [Kineococcus xinjiangensis]|uniref:Bacteriocin biosynthesis cyclodehydratase domain-containing protein n=1 Tax=Kineococcus xinjiangensis TaxID=512762 RepID=A0A2S6IWZ0_9ACTN|nr:hypothetical protein [Kineococcus xinjiangensis]PPK98750.1 bacteriocin biosynthesis cyclodehydratase domain-containing protein [Kineococcus xinjiangensis]